MKIYPELTFIPLKYANSPDANLSIITKNKKIIHPNIKDPFCILWLPLNLSEEVLNESIKNNLPNFPLDKSLTCFINLAYPKDWIQQEYFENISIGSDCFLLGNTIAKIIPVEKTPELLADLPIISPETYNQLKFSSSVYFWSLLTKLTLQLVANGSFIPMISHIASEETEKEFFDEKIGTMKSLWIPILKTENDIQIYKRSLEYATFSACNIPSLKKLKKVSIFVLPENLIKVFLDENEIVVTSKLLPLTKLSQQFIRTLLDSIIRISTNITSAKESNLPWEFRLLQSLLSDSKTFNIYDVKEEIIPKIFERWSQKLNLSWNLGYSLKFILETPIPSENQKEWILKFSLHSLLDEKDDIPLSEFWENVRNLSSEVQKNKREELYYIREYILKSLNILSDIYAPMSKTLREKYPYDLKLDSNEVVILLQTGIPKIQLYGYSIIIPQTFSLGGSQRIQPVLTIDSGIAESIQLKNYPTDLTSFDISSILTYEWVLKIGNNILSESEIEQLFKTDEKESLLFWNNKWIMVNKQDIEQFQENSRFLKGTMTSQEALKLALTQGAYLRNLKSENETSGPYPVQFYGPLERILKIIKGEMDMPHLPQPKNFIGVLRKYQEYGFNWMNVLTSIGFGCVLADDMGLGKTIQVIALILEILNDNKSDRKFLVVCPTSVLGNWMRELHKFAPTIKPELHYGSKRAKDISTLNKLLKSNDVILTSYNILRRDIELFDVVKWEAVILDESQNIKNYKTKQAKAVYELVDKVKRKIALSGTPIENRITELWSLYHFVNPFLLGTRSKFMKRYAIPVGKLGNGQLTNELRNLVNPFLLRRMKTNKNIIPELPDKQESEVFITLTEEQKQQYKNVVDTMLAKVKALEENSKQKFAQKGLILTALMHLKQICNHPDQYNHTELQVIQSMDVSQFIKKSGKLQRFIELLEEAIASESKILIFTQFKVMGDIIQDIIERYYNVQVPFIHGGVPQENRTRIVQLFQEDTSYQYPLLLLSLRAGGVGLNLSKATTVIHYDRWWNPAVEDQATDRAYRIGQKNKVNVYKMVAEGTIEEKISKMLEEKRAIAEKIIEVTGEEWITEFSLRELQEMFQLEEEE